MTPTQSRQLAERIAATLFTHEGSQVQRLVIEWPSQSLPGDGWTRQTFEDKVFETILVESRQKKLPGPER